MPQLDEYLRQLAPSMTQWRRDFHLHAESGWLEFRTASKVADILDGLGYQLALGRDVIDADSRMGLPDEETVVKIVSLANLSAAGFVRFVADRAVIRRLDISTYRVGPKALQMLRRLAEMGRL